MSTPALRIRPHSAAAALRWAQSSMVNRVTVAFFGLSFFTGFLAPSSSLSGWMEATSRVNPLTYVIAGVNDGVGWVLTILVGLAVAGASACVWVLHERQVRR